jgi:hypothetical protein
MRKKKRSRLILLLAVLVVVIVIVALIVFTNLGAQSSQVLAPGVSVGDEFTYDIQGLSSSNPNVTLPEGFYQFNMTDSYKITITDVSGPEVKLDTVWRFNNGTEIEGTGSVNLETGISSGGFWAIYGANLRVDDRVRPTGPDQSTVSETANRNYASGSRETNRVESTNQYYDANDPTQSTTLTEYMRINFDRQTGVLVEFHDISVYNNPQLTQTIVWTLRDTNVWNV